MKANLIPLAIGLLNTLGLAAYLLWLSSVGKDRLFYTQEGVLFLLPCVPIFLLYIMLFRGREKAGGDEIVNMENGK